MYSINEILLHCMWAEVELLRPFWSIYVLYDVDIGVSIRHRSRHILSAGYIARKADQPGWKLKFSSLVKNSPIY